MAFVLLLLSSINAANTAQPHLLGVWDGHVESFAIGEIKQKHVYVEN